MKCHYIPLLLCIFLLSAPQRVQAFDLADSLQIHGFISQGYLHSSDNNFLADSRRGSFEFTDVGLNANWALTDTLRVGSQLFYRNLGDYAEDKVVLDWALIDYQPRDWFGVRVGKVKMPLGLYNENRDNDFLSPTIFLPQSIYDESRRDTSLAYLGAGIHGNLPTGSWGDVDYHFFLGKSDFPDDSILNQGTESSLLSLIAKNKGKNPLVPASLESFERKGDDLYGGAMVFNSAVSGLRVGFSLLQSKNNVYVNGAATPLLESKIRSKIVVSLEYCWQDWVFVSEYGETDRQTKSAGTVTLDGPTQAWYAQLSYSPVDRWTFTALYDEFYRLKHDKDGASNPSMPPFKGWRKDVGVVVRFDVRDDLVLKAEYHTIDGGAMQLGVLNTDVDRFWNYFVAKLSYSF